MVSATIIAATLIMTPPDVEIPQVEKYNTLEIRRAVVRVCIELEIMDPKEQKNYQKEQDFVADLAVLRKRYDDLRDAPCLGECATLPPREQIIEFLSFNRAYRDNLVFRQILEVQNYAWYEQVIKETDELHRIWDHVADAQAPYYNVQTRRAALRLYKESLKSAGWNHLPPYIPIWRFNPIQ